MPARDHDRDMSNTINSNTTATADAGIETGRMDAFIDQYMQMWNESEAAVRRTTIEQLWAPDAVNATLTFYTGNGVLTGGVGTRESSGIEHF